MAASKIYGKRYGTWRERYRAVVLDNPQEDIRLILTRWGRSKDLRDPGHLYYPRQSPYCADMRSSGRWAAKMPPLREDVHMLIDEHVSELKNRGGHRHQAIVLAYVGGLRDRDIAKELKCGTTKAREARIAGEAWLEARIEIGSDWW